MPQVAHKARTNMSIDTTVLEDARALKLNMSAISEGALREAVRQAKAKAWNEENREILEEQEAWLRKHGHPLQEFMPDWTKEIWDDWRKEPVR